VSWRVVGLSDDRVTHRCSRSSDAVSTSRFELHPDEVGDRAKSFTYVIECEGAQTGGWSRRF
jgi:hypothetical protein